MTNTESSVAGETVHVTDLPDAVQRALRIAAIAADAGAPWEVPAALADALRAYDAADIAADHPGWQRAHAAAWAALWAECGPTFCEFFFRADNMVRFRTRAAA